MRKLAIAPFVFLALGCGTAQPRVGVTNTNLGIPKDSATQCKNLCSSIGFALDAVVVMADNVGCVCRAAAPDGAATSTAPGTSATGGMAAIMLQQEAAAAARRNQQQHRPSRPPPPPPSPSRPR